MLENNYCEDVNGISSLDSTGFPIFIQSFFCLDSKCSYYISYGMGTHFLSNFASITCEYRRWQFGDINPCEVVVASFTPGQLEEQTCPACRAAASSATCRAAAQAKQACRKLPLLYRRLLWSPPPRCRASAGSCQCRCLLPARPGFLNLTGATPLSKDSSTFPGQLCCCFRVLPPRDDIKMSGEKDELVQKAKLAEQAER